MSEPISGGFVEAWRYRALDDSIGLLTRETRLLRTALERIVLANYESSQGCCETAIAIAREALGVNP